MLIDVRPDDRFSAADSAVFAATAAMAGRAGWAYGRVNELSAVRAANLRWRLRVIHADGGQGRMRGARQVRFRPVLVRDRAGISGRWGVSAPVADALKSMGAARLECWASPAWPIRP